MSKYNYKTGLQEIGDGVFAYIREGIGWDICNSGLIVGEDECLVVDAMMVGSMVRSFMEDVRRVTDKPVRYVVDTHHHADHAFGNQFYRPDANVSDTMVVGNRCSAGAPIPTSSSSAGLNTKTTGANSN